MALPSPLYPALPLMSDCAAARAEPLPLLRQYKWHLWKPLINLYHLLLNWIVFLCFSITDYNPGVICATVPNIRYVRWSKTKNGEITLSVFFCPQRTYYCVFSCSFGKNLSSINSFLDLLRYCFCPIGEDFSIELVNLSYSTFRPTR